jgi:ligand-binding sensor domain-containing protein/two-component sensor histidine kinase
VQRALSIFLILFSLIGFSQEYRFIEYSVKDGLAQSQVTSVVQDNDGYIWIGTQGGLSKFDGVNFKNFSTNDGLVGNSITKVCLDKSNQLWVAANGGVSVLKKNGIESYKFTGDNIGQTVSDIAFLNDKVYLSTNGNGLFVLDKNTIKAVPKQTQVHPRIRAVIVKNDTLFLGTKEGLVYLNPEGDFLKYNLLLDTFSISSLTKFGDSLIVGTFGEGIFIHSNGKIKQVKHTDSRFNKPRSVFAANEGELWISTKNGVIELNKDKMNPFTEKEGLPNNNIYCVFSDKEENIWMGTNGNGIQKFSSFSFLNFNKEMGLSTNKIMTIGEDNRKNIWFGTIDRGVTLWDRKAFHNFEDIGTNNITVRCMLQDGDKMLFGTYDGIKTQVYNDKNQPVFSMEDRFKLLDGERVSKLFNNPNNDDLLIGTSRGFWISNTDSIYMLEPEKFGYSGTIRDIGADHEGQIFMSTTSGYYQFVNGSFKLVKIKKNENAVVNCFVFNKKNETLLGTNNGLFVGQGDEFERINLGTEFNENMINFIQLDKNENVYVGTNNGLFLVKKSKSGYSSENPMKFAVAHGLNSVETNLGASFLDDNNSLWFGTIGGVVKQIDNSNLFKKESTPKLRLLEFQLFFESKSWNDVSSLDEFGMPDGIELKASENHITFKFVGLFFKDPQNVIYQYRLKGVNELWSPETKQNEVTYPDLNSGDYTFEVRTKYGDGEWSEIEDVHFSIKAPYYKTVWFFLISTAVVLILFFTFFQYRLNMINRKKETEKLVLQSRLLALEQRSLNASMNRHFIFNSLNSIQYFINMKDRISANKYLTNFAKLIRKNLDSSTAEDNMVSLEDEMERLKLYLSLELMRFQGKFEYEFNLSERLDAEMIKIPSMMLQPFIENSIIHGVLPKKDGMGKIEINIEEEGGDFIVIEILDNGIGIDKSRKDKEHSQGDHISQGMKITQSRIEIIKDLTNKKLMLVGPKQINNNDGSIYGTHVLIKIPT